MAFKAKYIIIDILPVIFGEFIKHDDMARAINDYNHASEGEGIIQGAGFVRIVNGKYECYGESISLGVASREQVDSNYLNKYLGNES